MAVNLHKSVMRKEIEALRSAVPQESSPSYSEEACNRAAELLRGLPDRESGVACVYFPFGNELDVMPLIEQCWREGVPVAAPRTIPSMRRLQLHLVSGPDDLEIGTWGIREPRADCPLIEDYSSIAWMLMPGLAFDLEGSRLGYGGGYYDRLLEEMTVRGIPLPFRLAVVYDCQMVDKVPTEPHDGKVDAIVTEKRIIRCGSSM